MSSKLYSLIRPKRYPAYSQRCRAVLRVAAYRRARRHSPMDCILRTSPMVSRHCQSPTQGCYANSMADGQQLQKPLLTRFVITLPAVVMYKINHSSQQPNSLQTLTAPDMALTHRPATARSQQLVNSEPYEDWLHECFCMMCAVAKHDAKCDLYDCCDRLCD